jgi:hypothetical protein
MRTCPHRWRRSRGRGKPSEATHRDTKADERRGTYLRHIQPGGGGNEHASRENERDLHLDETSEVCHLW